MAQLIHKTWQGVKEDAELLRLAWNYESGEVEEHWMATGPNGGATWDKSWKVSFRANDFVWRLIDITMHEDKTVSEIWERTPMQQMGRPKARAAPSPAPVPQQHPRPVITQQPAPKQQPEARRRPAAAPKQQPMWRPAAAQPQAAADSKRRRQMKDQ